MKTRTLWINVTAACNSNCPFCLGKTQVDQASDNRLLRRALPRVLDFARFVGVDTAVITSAGEVLVHPNFVLQLLGELRQAGVPRREIHTNGLIPYQDPACLEDLAAAGATALGILAASLDPIRSARVMEVGLDYFELARRVTARGLLCRVNLSLLKGDEETVLDQFPSYVDQLFEHGVRQLTCRRPLLPDQFSASPEAAQDQKAWIEENAASESVLEELEKRVAAEGVYLGTLPHGVPAYHYRGVSVALEKNRTFPSDLNELRTLVLQPDGHLYRWWNLPGTVLL